MTKEEVYNQIETHYRESFEQLVNRLTGTTRSKHNAEDIVQEAYTRALQYWSSFKEDMQFGQWFHGILGNSTRDFFRNESVSGMGLDAANEVGIEPAVTYRLELNDMLSLIGDQPEHTANILRLFFINQYSVKEIEQLVPDNGAGIRKIVQRFREGLKDG